MDQLEKRFGRFAIPDLTVKFLFLQAIGYVLFEMLKLDGMRTYCEMNPYMILHHFQFWRLGTWLMIPTDGGLFLFIITAVFFYLPIGRQLEQTWGEFRYTFYLFLGFFFTVLGGFIVYGITGGMAITMAQGVLVKATGEVARRAIENGLRPDRCHDYAFLCHEVDFLCVCRHLSRGNGVVYVLDSGQNEVAGSS